MDLIKRIVWNERFWLSGNHTWDELERFSALNNVDLPKASDLVTAVYIGVAFIAGRIVFERFVFSRLSTRLLSSKAHFNKSKTKQNDDKKSFSEILWRLSCYLGMWFFGLIELSRKSWVWNTAEYWEDHLFKPVEPGVKWYYLVTIGMYISLTVIHYLEPRKKDFYMMLSHHIVTILLMTLSWISNFVRYGSLIVVLHDTADIPLDAAKFLELLGVGTGSDILFVIFIISWIATRLMAYPFIFLRSSWLETGLYFTWPGTVYILNVMLTILLGMHLMWSYFIFKTAYRRIALNKLLDARLEDDESTPTPLKKRK